MNTLTPYQQKAIDFSKHISLTANAGSGKTFVLSNRFVEIAVSQNISLNSIIAITFTDKAAGELYKKISDEIDDRLQKETSPVIVKRLEEIRRRLVSANISTIHSFCINVLKEFSPEAGIDANFLPADANTSEELIELSVEELFKVRNGSDELDENVKKLIRYFGSKTIMAKRVKNLLKNRKNVLEVEKNLYTKSTTEISDYFNRKFEEKISHILPDISELCKAVSIINNKVKQEKVNDFTIAIDEAIHLIRQTHKITDKLIQLIIVKNNILTKSGIRNRSYLSNKMREALDYEIETVNNFFAEFDKLKFENSDISLNDELASFGKLILDVFSFAHSIYEQKKKELSLLDFEDILLKTRDVLQNDFVREQLNAKYKFIMIDEYQDTNEIQYDILMPILQYLNAGNLFIVGDEKQSIYRFRDAEPEIFRKTTKKIIENEINGSELNLPHSFRVSPPIAFFVNIVFKELFKNYNAEYNEVKYDELLCARNEKDSGKIEVLLYEENDTNNNETESDLLAKKILMLCGQNLENKIEFGNVAVLCRKRALFAELEKTFIYYKIPYSITGGKGFFQRQSIYDIFNFISFVLNPDEDIALFGILRSPFFLLPDTVIFEISLMRGKTFFQKFKNYSRKKVTLYKIVEQLNNFIEFASTAPIVALLRKIINDTGYWSIVAAKNNSQQEIANIEKLIHVANGFSQQGFHTLYDFKEYLAAAIDKVEDESQAPINEEDNSVKIMTVHQSKGLEFDTVFLYKCNETSMKEAVKSREIYLDKELGLLAKVPRNGDYFGNYLSAPVVSIYNYVTTRKSKAELKRLLYVAITRAKNNLIITASHKNFKFKEDSFMKLLASGLRTGFSESSIPISGKLQFMKSAEENYSTYSKEISIEIPIITSIDIKPKIEIEKTQTEYMSKQFMVELIPDFEKEEIISATKIAYFKQCPVKYQLTYEFGYAKLLRLISLGNEKTGEDFGEESKENNEYLPADIKGKIIHSLLENETLIENVEAVTKKMLQNEYSAIEGNKNIITKFTIEISRVLKKYYSSDTFKQIKKYKKFKNEFEIYVKINDYYLYGIIDKLIIEKNKLTIVDYKTGKITKAEFSERVKNYIPQLLFYSFIVKNIYSDIKNIEIKLIFLNEPDFPFTKEISLNELIDFGEEVQDIIKKIREKNFIPNKTHCFHCYLADGNNNCPLKQQTNQTYIKEKF